MQEFWLTCWEVIQEMRRSGDVYPPHWKKQASYLESHEDNLDIQRDTDWPVEKQNVEHARSSNRIKLFIKEALQKNQELRLIKERELLLEEVICLRLYTGPLFEKYNAVNRGVGKESKFMFDKFVSLCGGAEEKEAPNTYTTTIHVLTSGLIKVSKLSKAVDLFRGMSGGVLPDQFWEADASGVLGGVEFGFMSTTTNKDVAFQYAKGKGATILEIKTGMIDKGADLSWVSQYPHEKDQCEPMAVSILQSQVIGTRVEQGVLVISQRLNLNYSSGTIEDVVGKRRKVIKDMCQNLFVEAQGDVAKWQFCDIGNLRDELLTKVKSLFDSVGSYDIGEYNNDAMFKEYSSGAIAIRQAVSSVRQMLEFAENSDHSFDAKEVFEGIAPLYRRAEVAENQALSIWRRSLSGQALKAFKLLKEECDRIDLEEGSVKVCLMQLPLGGEAARIAGEGLRQVAKTSELHARSVIESVYKMRRGGFDAFAKIAVCNLLGDGGKAAVPIVSAVAEYLNDADEAVRKIALLALGQHGEAAATHLSAIGERLADEKQDVRDAAFQVLGQNVEARAPAVGEAVVPWVAASEADTRIKVCYLLGKLGEAAVPHLEAVAKCLSDDDQDVRVAARWALGKHGEAGRRRQQHGLLGVSADRSAACIVQ